MKTLNKISFFTFLISFQISMACPTPPSFITLKGTSLEKHEISILGSEVIFDRSSKEEVRIFFDKTEGKWCTKGPGTEIKEGATTKKIGCLLGASDGTVTMLGLSTTGNMDLTKKTGTEDVASARIKIEKNSATKRDILILCALDKKGKEIKNQCIKFDDKEDASTGGMSRILSATGPSGGELSFLYGSRGIVPKAVKTIDMKTAESVAIGCGAKNHSTNDLNETHTKKTGKGSR